MMREVYKDSKYIEYVQILEAMEPHELKEHDFAGSRNGGAMSFINGGEQAHIMINILKRSGMIWYPTLDQLFEIMDRRYKEFWTIDNHIGEEEGKIGSGIVYGVEIDWKDEEKGKYKSPWFKYPEVALLHTILFEPRYQIEYERRKQSAISEELLDEYNL